VRARLPEALTIFILPPSLQALRERLQNRRTDAPAVIDRRLRDAVSDMSHWREFDYVVVNDAFEDAVAALESILDGKGEALRRERSELNALTRLLLGPEGAS
jgi:guanylate kinase